MEDNSRQDIRRLLRTFGVKADEALTDHLSRNPRVEKLRVRISLHDLTDYGGLTPEGALALEIEDEISGAG